MSGALDAGSSFVAADPAADRVLEAEQAVRIASGDRHHLRLMVWECIPIGMPA